ncbi:MAG: hypothetical protein ACXVY6_08950, partial [Gaiellaceae bacterium]
MNPITPTRNFFGILSTKACPARGYVLVQRDLGPTEIARLERDLRRLSAGIVRVSAAYVDFDVPLSRTMSVALFELSQRLELPMTLSVPPL